MDFTAAVNRYLAWLQSDDRTPAPTQPQPKPDVTFADGEIAYHRGRPRPDAPEAAAGWDSEQRKYDPNFF